MALFAAMRFSSFMRSDENPESPFPERSPSSDCDFEDVRLLRPDNPSTTPIAIEIPNDFKGLLRIV